MVQDAPLSGVDLPVPLLIKMAKEIETVKCFKIECAQAASKLRKLVVEGGDAIEGPFDGEEGITLFADLEAGATGNMSSAMIPDLIKPVVLSVAPGWQIPTFKFSLFLLSISLTIEIIDLIVSI